MRKYKHMTSGEFNKIKALQDEKLGLTNSQVAAIAKRSVGTISSIKRTASLEEYQALVKKYVSNKKQIVEAETIHPESHANGHKGNGITPTSVSVMMELTVAVRELASEMREWRARERRSYLA